MKPVAIMGFVIKNELLFILDLTQFLETFVLDFVSEKRKVLEEKLEYFASLSLSLTSKVKYPVVFFCMRKYTV